MKMCFLFKVELKGEKKGRGAYSRHRGRKCATFCSAPHTHESNAQQCVYFKLQPRWNAALSALNLLPVSGVTHTHTYTKMSLLWRGTPTLAGLCSSSSSFVLDVEGVWAGEAAAIVQMPPPAPPSSRTKSNSQTRPH